MAPTGQKRTKTATTVASLEDAFGVVLSWIPIFASISEFLSSDLLKKTPTLIFGLISGVFRASADEMNTHVVPAPFLPFDVERDSNGKIVSIKDNKNKMKLSTEKMRRVLALEACRSANCKAVVWNETDGKLDTVFMVLDNFSVENCTVDAEAGGKKPIYMMYQHKRQVPLFLKPNDLYPYLSLSYIKLAHLSKVVFDTNHAAKVGQLPDVGKLKDLKSLVDSIRKAEEKRKAMDLLNTLMINALEGATDEERVQAFELCPSATLARELGLATVYRVQLYTKTKASAPKVRFADVPPGTLIAMNKAPMAESEYIGLPGDISAEMVYVYEENLGVIKNRKWVQARGVASMPKELVARVYAAVAKAKGGGGDSKPAASSGDQQNADEEEFEEF